MLVWSCQCLCFCFVVVFFSRCLWLFEKTYIFKIACYSASYQRFYIHRCHNLKFSKSIPFCHLTSQLFQGSFFRCIGLMIVWDGFCWPHRSVDGMGSNKETNLTHCSFEHFLEGKRRCSSELTKIHELTKKVFFIWIEHKITKISKNRLNLFKDRTAVISQTVHITCLFLTQSCQNFGQTK